MKLFRVLFAVLALATVGTTFLGSARADDYDKKTILTFSHPIEVPGNVVLPAGKYTFKLLEGNSARNVVQIWNADGSKLLATILAISDYRLKPTANTVIEFNERKGNQPHAVRAWFYPNETIGREFVYPRARAVELAQVNKVVVPAETVEPTPAETPAEMAKEPVVAITPEAKEEPVEQAIETTPPVEVAENVQQLPHTASSIPLIALLGAGLIGTALGLKRLAKQHV